ncbi:MAG: hypothetical protein ACOY3Z_09650 [Thermodesulfobacteriota bacterium]
MKKTQTKIIGLLLGGCIAFSAPAFAEETNLASPASGADKKKAISAPPANTSGNATTATSKKAHDAAKRVIDNMK